MSKWGGGLNCGWNAVRLTPELMKLISFIPGDIIINLCRSGMVKRLSDYILLTAALKKAAACNVQSLYF